MKTSRLPGFYKLSVEDRLKIVKEFADLTGDELELLKQGGLTVSLADKMIENVIGVFSLPLAVAVNFLINGKDYLVPMAIEEPSVVAAASHAAKLMREGGGIKASSTPPVMIGQVQLIKVPDIAEAKEQILSHKGEILEIANAQSKTLVKLGGGAIDLQVREISTSRGAMLLAELLVDCRDAMGANIVNTMCEAIAPTLERLSKGKALLRILSNLADRRLARAEAVIPKKELGGEEIVEGIVDAYALAASDPYRAATHNKGIMNGIIAVALATGQDTRALEAGAHAYAARTGRYQPFSKWEVTEGGDLKGSLELPLAVGIVGGATRAHPLARLSLKILGVKTANELAEVMCSVGLAQNLAALRALVTEGIQRGHMKLHARNLALSAGAPEHLVDLIVERMLREKNISLSRAKEILREVAESSENSQDG